MAPTLHRAPAPPLPSPPPLRLPPPRLTPAARLPLAQRPPVPRAALLPPPLPPPHVAGPGRWQAAGALPTGRPAVAAEPLAPALRAQGCVPPARQVPSKCPPHPVRPPYIQATGICRRALGGAVSLRHPGPPQARAQGAHGRLPAPRRRAPRPRRHAAPPRSRPTRPRASRRCVTVWRRVGDRWVGWCHGPAVQRCVPPDGRSRRSRQGVMTVKALAARRLAWRPAGQAP